MKGILKLMVGPRMAAVQQAGESRLEPEAAGSKRNI